MLYHRRMAQPSIKDEARELVERLPDDATWADLADIIAMHEVLARARRERAEGKFFTLEEVEEEFGFTG